MILWHWLGILAWLLWLFGYWRGGLDIIADIRATRSKQDLAYLLILSIITIVLIMTLFSHAYIAPQSSTFVILGTILVILGVIGTFYCRHYLGKQWTAEVNLQTNHQIIDTGPYTIVRHPIYTCAIILYLGTAMAFFNIVTALLVPIAILTYILKTAYEDAFLMTQLDGYKDYGQRVPYRLVPYIW